MLATTSSNENQADHRKLQAERGLVETQNTATMGRRSNAKEIDMSSDLWNNDYSAAGKGHKARQRERLNIKTIPKKLATTRTKPKNSPKPYQMKPEQERKRNREEVQSQAFHSAVGIKARIRIMAIEDASFLDICDKMKRINCPVSSVTISNLRTETREIIKLLDKEGLLNVEALARRRKRIKEGKAV